MYTGWSKGRRSNSISLAPLSVKAPNPVVLEVVGSAPPTGWRIDTSGARLDPVPAGGTAGTCSVAEPGALAELVHTTAEQAAAAVLARSEDTWLRWALGRPEPLLRDAALAVLEGGRDATPFAAELFEILVTPSRPRTAVRVFRTIGKAAGPVLAEAVASEDVTRRDAALEWTATLGSDAAAAIPAVAALVESGQVPTSTLFRVISAVGPRAGAATAALAAFVRERRERYELALDVLADIGPAAKAALPDVLTIAQTRPGYGHGRLRATLALASIQPGHPELEGFIVACLDDANTNVIELMCLHVGSRERVSSRIRRALMNASKHPEPRVQRAAKEALGRLR